MRLARLLLFLPVISCSISPEFYPTRAMAQQTIVMAPPPPCSGNLNIVRISEVKPGMMQAFLDAAAAQAAWYAKAGAPDEVYVMRLMVQNPATKAFAYSETEVLSNHIEPATRDKPLAHDPGYDAFVAKFQASSTVKAEYVTCAARM